MSGATAVFFLVGAGFSAAIGYLGMSLAVQANLRVAAAANTVGRDPAMKIGFRTGAFVAERSGTLWVVKSGFENRVFSLSKAYGDLYGIFAVALAIFTGWLGRVMFKRD